MTRDNQAAADQDKNKKPTILTTILNYAMGLALYAMVTFVFINAVLRYCFNSGWPESEEISRFLFVWVSMLGAIIAYSQNKHVGVDLVLKKLKPKALRVVTGVGLVLVLTILVIVFYGGINYFLTIWRTPAPATGLPMGILAVALLVCMGAMIFITIKRLIQCVRGGAAKEENT